MKNTVAKMADILILVLVNLMWGQDNKSLDPYTNIPYISQSFNIQTGMTKSKGDEHIKEYYEKFKLLGLLYDRPKNISPNPILNQMAYYYRINLNAIKEFKKVGIDLVELSKYEFGAERSKLRENVLNHPLIVIATVKDSISPINASKGCVYSSKFIFKVDEILAGEYLYDKKPEYLTVYYEGGYDINYEGKIVPKRNDSVFEKYLGFYSLFGIGEQVILFLDKYNVDKESYSKGAYPPDYKKNTVFLSADCIARKIEDNKVKLRINPTQERYQLDPDYKYHDINEVKKIIKQIDKINDPANFYKRSYK